MNRFRTIWFALAALSVMAGAGAQDRKPGEYVLAPDDVIMISVPGYDEFSQKMFVTRDGRIALPEIGALQAAGKTARELEKDLQIKLEKVRNNVSVSVLLLDTASKRVQIIGPVKTVGRFTMGQDWRLLDLIAAAGGLLSKSNMTSAKLVRGNKTVELDFQKANEQPESEANIKLVPDDTILLIEREATHWFVTINGEVMKKGVTDLTPDMDLPKLLAMAVPTELADLGAAHILRGSEVIPVDLQPTFEAKADPKVQNFKLKNGDTLYIPTIKTKFSVLGAVGRPGTFPLPASKPITVLDAITLAQTGPQSDLKGAGILRFEDGAPKVIKVNMEALVKKADVTGNIPLKDKDVLYIPQKGRSGFHIEDLLTPFALFRYLVP